VAPYNIHFHDETGALRETRTMLFEHDDAAIDHVGAFAHPHEMNIWQGERHVARFPPWPAPRRRR